MINLAQIVPQVKYFPVEGKLISGKSQPVLWGRKLRPEPDRRPRRRKLLGPRERRFRWDSYRRYWAYSVDLLPSPFTISLCLSLSLPPPTTHTHFDIFRSALCVHIIGTWWNFSFCIKVFAPSFIQFDSLRPASQRAIFSIYLTQAQIGFFYSINSIIMNRSVIFSIQSSNCV